MKATARRSCDCDGVCLLFFPSLFLSLSLHAFFSNYFMDLISFVYEVKELNALSLKYKDADLRMGRRVFLFGFIENCE